MKLSDHREEIAHSYFEEGESYQEIANRYGKSREAVRQFLNKYFPDRVPGVSFRKELNEQKRAVVEAERVAKALERAVPCVVCGDPVLRRTGGQGTKRACSSKHSSLWAKARFLLDEEMGFRQRRSTAKSILKHPRDHSAGKVSWAKKVVAGKASAGRKFAPRDSEARRAYEEVMEIRKAKYDECK